MAVDSTKVTVRKSQGTDSMVQNHGVVRKNPTTLTTKMAIDDRGTGNSYRQIEKLLSQQQEQLQELGELLQEVKALKIDMTSVSHTAQQIALQGATKAQADMVAAAKKSMEKVTKENLRQIDEYVKESQRKIEKLKKTTLFEQFNPVAIWITLVMILGMLGYILCFQ